MFTLQNFKRKVYPINSLVPAFFFRAKSNSDLKTQICIYCFCYIFKWNWMNAFSWWDYCLPYHVRPHLICETWSPKIEKILSDKFGYSTHRPAQMPFCILLHISNMNQTKLGQRNKPFTKEWTTYNCSCWCLLIIKNMRKKLWKETLYTARIHSSERKFGTFVLPSFLPLLLYDNKCDKDCIEMRLTIFQEA